MRGSHVFREIDYFVLCCFLSSHYYSAFFFDNLFLSYTTISGFNFALVRPSSTFRTGAFTKVCLTFYFVWGFPTNYLLFSLSSNYIKIGFSLIFKRFLFFVCFIVCSIIFISFSMNSFAKPLGSCSNRRIFNY